MRVGFDIDGVLADIITAIKSYFFNEYYKIETEDIKTYKIQESIPWISKEMTDDAFNNPKFYAYMKINKQAVDVINSLFDNDIVIEICTARPFDLWETTLNWLKRKNINYNRIAFIEPKDRFDYVKQRGMRFFVEDNLETALQLQDICKTFLVDAPYNQYSYSSNFTRIKTKKDWKMLKESVLLLDKKEQKKEIK